METDKNEETEKKKRKFVFLGGVTVQLIQNQHKNI